MNETNPQFEDQGQRPWTVIVRDGVVIARYRAEDSYATAAGVNRVSFGNEPVDIYEVPAGVPPPEIGDHIGAEDVQRWSRAPSSQQNNGDTPTVDKRNVT